MSRQVRELLATGNTPACWQREMARKTAWVDRLRLAGTWTKENVALDYTLTGEPLCGNSLIALTIENQQARANGTAPDRQPRSKPGSTTRQPHSTRPPVSEIQKGVHRPQSATSINPSSNANDRWSMPSPTEIEPRTDPDNSIDTSHPSHIAPIGISHTGTNVKAQEGLGGISHTGTNVKARGVHAGISHTGTNIRAQEVLEEISHTGTNVKARGVHVVTGDRKGRDGVNPSSTHLRETPVEMGISPNVRVDRALLYRLAGELTLVQNEKRSQLSSLSQERRHSTVDIQAIAQQPHTQVSHAFITQTWQALHPTEQTNQAQETLHQQWATPITGPTAPLDLLLNSATVGAGLAPAYTRAYNQRNLIQTENHHENGLPLHRTIGTTLTTLYTPKEEEEIAETAITAPPLVAARTEEATEPTNNIMPPTVAAQLPSLLTLRAKDGNTPIPPVATATVTLGSRFEMTIEDDLDILATKIKRILDDEARRHGIDV